MTRSEIQCTVNAIVAALSNAEYVAVADIGEPLVLASHESLVVPGGLPVSPEYFAFLTQANGLSIRLYNRGRVGPGHFAYPEFEVIGAARIVSATEEFRSFASDLLRGALGTSLQSYPHERDRRVLNESMFVGTSASPTLLWSSGGAESGVYIVDDEYAGEPNFLLRVASTFDEYLERSLRAMLENEGLPVYY